MITSSLTDGWSLRFLNEYSDQRYVDFSPNATFEMACLFLKIRSFLYLLNLNPRFMKKIFSTILLFGILLAGFAQTEINPKIKTDKDKQFVTAEVDRRAATYKSVARNIWGFAELGFQESKSSEQLINLLKSEGFTVETGVSGMPTAFVASYGSGGPVIGILAEFDALPGLSQDSVPFKKPLMDGRPGHACGHNLFGAASSAAAITLKDWITKNKKAGTIRVFGTPAEEGGGAKVYMVRDGLFKDVDAVLHWHPSNHNDASPESCMAIKQTLFRFYGRAAHAAAAPEKGRSALDGIESMNYMVNMMREHIPSDARIHYVITKGGLAANIVPDFAEVEYMVRHPDARALAELEWVMTQPLTGGAQPRTEAMFVLAGVAPPSRVIQCEALAAMSILRHSDVVGIVPRPLLGHPETRGIVAVEDTPLRPCDIELLLLTQPDAPLTAAAEYFAHCLMTHSQPV